jgi:hypothetical protein
MFYKSASSSRSTVLTRFESHRPESAVPADDAAATELARAAREKEARKNPKLSPFEQELFQAWFDD